MAKKRKQQNGGNSAVALKKFKPDTETQLEEVQPDIANLIYADELETTTDTLLTLASHPELISLKALKPFRTAVHDYWRVASNAGSSLTSRISAALSDHRHVDALVLLSEMEIRGQLPKLGALQRWVRECDAVLVPGMEQEEEGRIWSVLAAILRTTQPGILSGPSEGGGSVTPGSRVRWFAPFSIDSPSAATTAASAPFDLTNAVSSIKPLHTTPGPERRPPNKHPAVIYYSPPGTFPLLPGTGEPQRFDVPGVPGAFIIHDVFTTAECQSLIAAAEAVGLHPDEPTAGSAAQLSSVLAHNFIWLADARFHDEMYARVERLLPQTINHGRVRGINKRFRVYRYTPGSVYRPHIDGAWPASALSPSTHPEYIYDSDPALYSRLTFLIYLNDDFDGGCTTFFLPSASGPAAAVMDARPVRPRTGAVCVFPHGGARGSLLHEGSGVTSGAKYVVRTEVLYEVDAAERVRET